MPDAATDPAHIAQTASGPGPATSAAADDRPPRRKKLIEVALPLDAINAASAREKSIRHGHPSTLHLWWARRPLAACRAVLFSSFVDDPESDPAFADDPERAYGKRAELFALIEDLVLWENSNNASVINRARFEIARCVASRMIETGELQRATIVFDPESKTEGQPHPDGALPSPGIDSGTDPADDPRVTAARMAMNVDSDFGTRPAPEAVNHFLATYAPPVLDPFAGGGSIPLEAQRLGLRAHASDLNPVAVLINKALIEIPPKFAGLPPVHPEAEQQTGWSGAAGLAEDVRRYGRWMRDEAEKRIGHLYPKVEITEAMAKQRKDLKPYVGQELTVIAWLWCRTIKCPSPGCGCRMPMARSFWLSKKTGRKAYAEPIVDRKAGKVRFEIRHEGEPQEETSNRQMARCLFCGNTMKKEQLRQQARQFGMEPIPLAVVAEGNRGRVYLEATDDVIPDVEAPDAPEIDQLITDDKRWFSPPQYGLPTFRDLFTPRQLTALVTFSDLVGEARANVLADAERTWLHPNPDPRPLHQHGHGPQAYADAVATYLAFTLSRQANRATTICPWNLQGEKIEQTFGRQAIPMTWDFAESNPLGSSSGNWLGQLKFPVESLESCFPGPIAEATQRDAVTAMRESAVVSTDPPYYDNIGYSDLSDFFHVWLRRSLKLVHPNLLGTLLTPKESELIATPYRHGGSKQKAASFFEQGLGEAIGGWRKSSSSDWPATIFYAFRQAESDDSGTSSTGWETFLQGIIEHGFSITATWPVRTEKTRGLKIAVNALASSIVLTCIPRGSNARIATRREFNEKLQSELPGAIRTMQSGNVAPVDLAQASIGPGMAVFSRYRKVVNADGSAMSVREALQLINEVLDETLSEQEGDHDAWTRWAVAWFEDQGMAEGPYGKAETLSTAKGVSVQGVVDAGIAHARGGKVRLLRRDEIASNWDPAGDERLTVWEVTQYLVKALEEGGEDAAARLLKQVGPDYGDRARELAYRLYQVCERKKWARDALGYNSLVASWPTIDRRSREIREQPSEMQAEMYE